MSSKISTPVIAIAAAEIAATPVATQVATAITATATVTEKVTKKKSLTIKEPCSLAGNPISMVTEQVELGISNPDKKEVIAITGIDDEIAFIDTYIDKYGATHSSMKKIDSDLTNKLVKNVVSALIAQHTALGEEGDKKKFSLSQKVLAGFTEWNKALEANAKFEADTEYPLNVIAPETIKEFTAANADLIEELGEDFSPTDLYIKAELLSAISWFVENPITKIVDLGEQGTEAITEEHEDYVPFVKKPVVANPKQAYKNISSINIEYNLAYITLAYLISSFDDYTVKRLEREIKKYFSDYSTENVKKHADDTAKLLKLAKRVGVEDDAERKIAIRLFTILNDKNELKKLAPKDKKLKEKLANPDAKWPEKVDINAFAREYTEWALVEDEAYGLLHHELDVALQLQEISKRFVVCGNAADITKTDGLVDTLVLSLESKFAEYSSFLNGKFEAEPKGKFTETYCGRKVVTTKKKRCIDPLTDNQLLLGLKVIEETATEEGVAAKGVATKSVATPAIPCYGSYMRKLYKMAIKNYKFAFSSCDKTFGVLFEHIVRDTVNLYTSLAIDSHNKFSNSEIYSLNYDQLSRYYSKAETDKLDTFIKKLTSFANHGVVTIDDLPDHIPMVVDLYDSFEWEMEPHAVHQPGSAYNLHCPLASADLARYRRDASNHFKREHNIYTSLMDVEEAEADAEAAAAAEEDAEDEDDEEVVEAPKKTKKRRTEPTIETTFRTYYKASAAKSGNKNTIRFLTDLSMAVAYIVNLRLVWLGKLITFTSGEIPYHSVDDRKDYVAGIVRNQIETVSSSHASNEAFKSCVVSLTKELKTRSGSLNGGDIEKELKEDLKTVRTAGRTELNAQEEALRTESERLNAKGGRRAAATKERPWISAKEKKVYGSTAFHSNLILDKVHNKKLDSSSQELFVSKISRLHDCADRLSSENRNPIEVDNEPHTTMMWSYPIKPYTNNNSISLINVTLQRTLHNVVEDCLTTQFYNTDNKKKNMINGDLFNSILNISRGNEIW